VNVESGLKIEIMAPLYSIIIPHYDIPDLLMRCLKSIPVSEDIQVIVVDDNSPDADTYLERYPELSRPNLEFVRTTKGGGAGYARNVGLDHAKGKWLLFADADDFFVDKMYDIILSHVDSDADVIFYRKKDVRYSDINHEIVQQVYLDEIMDTFIHTGDEWPIRTHFYVSYCKMIKRALVVEHNIRFEEVKYSNDIFFSVSVGLYAKRIEAVDKVLYYKTYYRPGALTTNFCSKPNELKIRTDVVFRIDKYLLQHNMCRERHSVYYLNQMFNKDWSLFKNYFKRLDEIYPSKWSAIIDISKGQSLKYKVKLIVFLLLQKIVSK
jgi:glycosyltransferase involved in cell wall biosynthesis